MQHPIFCTFDDCPCHKYPQHSPLLPPTKYTLPYPAVCLRGVLCHCHGIVSVDMERFYVATEYGMSIHILIQLIWKCCECVMDSPRDISVLLKLWRQIL